ncbi:hypothetical protein SAMN04489727_6092 [Amycolatopsis tolypomycina]|uniref:Uncharacterized protein n=1 Tax=Amycolatopsis tolypomycina TaxID=208445 RepID=A0A1H4XCC5_9PSEU|nr:hypothetical protein [Amycolatopsis tolypomycina]SED03249.1 hypothetical protein SAMN04489727_6092 [Amycolatopsis tolypomycina]
MGVRAAARRGGGPGHRVTATVAVAAAVLAGAPAAAAAPAPLPGTNQHRSGLCGSFVDTASGKNGNWGPGCGSWTTITLVTRKPGKVRHVIIELTDAARWNEAAADRRRAGAPCPHRP